MLHKALEFLHKNQKQQIGERVVYKHKDVEKTVTAVIGKTVFRVEDPYEVYIKTVSKDFLIMASDLGLEPKRGDQISIHGKNYEVLAPNNEPVWRWTDTSECTYRIHTKEIT